MNCRATLSDARGSHRRRSTRDILPCRYFLDDRIDRRFHGVGSLVAALVGDDEYAKIIFWHDVDVALRSRHAAVVRVINTLQAVASNNAPKIADAELGIEFDQGSMRF